MASAEEVWQTADGRVHTKCLFCGEEVSGEMWEDLDNHMMVCRERASPQSRGDLEGIPEQELRILARNAQRNPLA